MNEKVNRLLNGETFKTKEFGNSMLPKIRSGQEHIIEPATWDSVKRGDIVYCKVKSTFYTHLVKTVDPNRGCLICNSRGRINGWTKQVYGKVIEIL